MSKTCPVVAKQLHEKLHWTGKVVGCCVFAHVACDSQHQSIPESLRINLSCVWSERALETCLKISGGSRALGKILQELLGMKSQPNAASENRTNRINIYLAGNRETQSCHFI